MDAIDATELVHASGDLLQRTTARLNLRRRSRILGLPIGPKRTDWRKVGMIGAGAVAVAAGTAGVARAGRKSHDDTTTDEGTTTDEYTTDEDTTTDGESGGGQFHGAEDVEEKLGDLSEEERALVHALKEIEAQTEGTVASIGTLERDEDSDGAPAGWVLTVGLRATEESTNGVQRYRVVADADGSLRDCQAIDDSDGGE